MIIRHGIETLRGDTTSQLRAQSRMMAARQAWSRAELPDAIFADMRRYGAGADLAECASLSAMIGSCAQATIMAQALIGELGAAVSDEPLGSVPLRHNLTESGASLMLASEGRAQLLLAERAPCAVEAESVSFAQVERIDLVLAGRGSGRIVERDAVGAAPSQTAVSLEPGFLYRTSGNGQRRALLTDRVRQSLVTLRLVRHPEAVSASPTVQVSLQDGSEQRRAAATITESRQEMALSLLGAMGRSDAAPIAAEMSREGPLNLRWQAVRQCLAMDTGTGFTALTALAAQPDDPLAPHAKALRDQLIAAHPVLEQLAA